MAVLNSEHGGILESISDSPPTHYTVKIELFSMITEIFTNDGYESSQFEAGGYKWKLVLYPNGNKRKNVRDHISLYLVIAETDSLPIGWEVYVDFRLFLLDQNKRAYSVFEDAFARKKCFNSAVLDAVGFDKLIPIKDFIDAFNGYLVDDTFMYGAEVYVSKERRTGKGECLRRIKIASMYKHVWKLENFPELGAKVSSESFKAGGYQWKILLYPKGIADGKDSHISMFLALADPKTLLSGSVVFADYTLRIIDQIHDNHKSMTAATTGRNFSALNPNWGFRKFITQEMFSKAEKGFLLNDTCILEAEVTVRGITRAL